MTAILPNVRKLRLAEATEAEIYFHGSFIWVIFEINYWSYPSEDMARVWIVLN